MIGKNSPLRRYPQSLAPEQVLFLDGVRFSVEATELAYARLKRLLRHLALKGSVGATPRMVEAILEAWSVIDGLNRFRSLVMKPPRMKGDLPPAVQGFLTSTRSVRDLRNHSQHLLGKVERIVSLGIPIWGSLAWVTWDRTFWGRRRSRACSLQAGTVFPTRDGMLRVGAIFPASFVDEPILLRAANESVRLDASVEAMRSLVVWLEAFFNREFQARASDIPKTIPDVLATMTLNVAELKRVWTKAERNGA